MVLRNLTLGAALAAALAGLSATAAAAPDEDAARTASAQSAAADAGKAPVVAAIAPAAEGGEVGKDKKDGTGGETAHETAHETAKTDAAASPAGASAVTVDWDAGSGTLSVRSEDASLEALAGALEASGVEVKVHPSWESRRFSIEFDRLPLREAVAQLFGKSYVLMWANTPAEAGTTDAAGAKRPRIVLMMVEEKESEAKTASAADRGAKDAQGEKDAQALEALAASAEPKEVVRAIESALRGGERQLRAAAVQLMARNGRFAVSDELLREVVKSDPDPAIRTAAIHLIRDRVDALTLETLQVAEGAGTTGTGTTATGTGTAAAGSGSASGSGSFTLETTSSAGSLPLETLNEAASDPDPVVQQEADKAREELIRRAEFLSSLTQFERDWLFHEDILGPLEQQLEAIRRREAGE